MIRCGNTNDHRARRFFQRVRSGRAGYRNHHVGTEQAATALCHALSRFGVDHGRSVINAEEALLKLGVVCHQPAPDHRRRAGKRGKGGCHQTAGHRLGGGDGVAMVVQKPEEDPLDGVVVGPKHGITESSANFVLEGLDQRRGSRTVVGLGGDPHFDLSARGEKGE